ncbi:MAG: 50S ribosomal protein L3 [Thermodesulfovibrionales bacterium]|nr:50S ribosomal protein L3 [Thermodesulfovibrionales bacterium]
MTGILGKKIGMTQIFSEDGVAIPVTIIQAGPCPVIELKIPERDGYEAVKICFDEITKIKNVTKPVLGIFKKAGLKPHRIIREFRMTGLKVGDLITVERFKKGDRVDVSGISKGKGFQGIMKRCRAHGGPGSHGSMFNRAPGSIGSSSFPSRVWKNKSMPGHMGAERVTVKNLTVIEVMPEKNLLLVKGAVPGAYGSYVEIRKED